MNLYMDLFLNTYTRVRFKKILLFFFFFKGLLYLHNSKLNQDSLAVWIVNICPGEFMYKC